jgi:hypothetical protein
MRHQVRTQSPHLVPSHSQFEIVFFVVIAERIRADIESEADLSIDIVHVSLGEPNSFAERVVLDVKPDREWIVDHAVSPVNPVNWNHTFSAFRDRIERSSR